MTKVTSLDPATDTKKELKPIVFLYYLNNFLMEADVAAENILGAHHTPAQFDNIQLICKDYLRGHDLMFAWNNAPEERSHGYLFVGKFNDGIVE